MRRLWDRRTQSPLHSSNLSGHDNRIGHSCKCVSYQQKLKERRRPDSGVKFAKR